MYNSLSGELKRRFGCKVYKLALDGNMTCPNRDGTIGRDGCIFCNGSGDFAAPFTGSVTEQIETAKKRVRSKAKDGKYIAYFQSFTNTYAPVSRLESLFTEAIDHPDIVALSVATRPDCLPDDVVALLGRLAKHKPVWIELGLQTIHEKTAERIHRGYSLPVFDDAVKRLHGAGLEVIVHMILGLPGETAEEMYETAAYIGRSGAEGIKIHLLYVAAGTALEREYREGRYTPLTLETYRELLAGVLRRLPPEMVIHRLTGDGAKRSLVAPLWSADKHRVLNDISDYLKANNVVQGELFASGGQIPSGGL